MPGWPPTSMRTSDRFNSLFIGRKLPEKIKNLLPPQKFFVARPGSTVNNNSVKYNIQLCCLELMDAVRTLLVQNTSYIEQL